MFITNLPGRYRSFGVIAASILLAIMGIFSVTAPAAPPTKSEKIFKRAAQALPQKLLALGIRRVGQIDLRDVLAGINKVNLVETSEEAVAAANGNGRRTARWEINGESRTIYFSTFWFKRPFLEVLPVFALHEYLGVLGYEDSQYRVSVGLWFLSHPSTRQMLTADEYRIISAVIARHATVRFAKGGVVGVGGGGQFLSVVYRAIMMLNTLQYFKRPEMERHRGRMTEVLTQFIDDVSEVTYSLGKDKFIRFHDGPGR